MADLQQLHLNAPYCSKRAVRYRLLSPTAVDQVIASAGKMLGPGSTIVEFTRFEHRFGVEAMVLYITREPCANEEAVSSTETKWIPFDPESGLLNGKDWALLCKVYARDNGVTEDEVSAVMGKARTVSVD